MLLHGFPETSAMWEPLMGALAAAGYRCAAPDQRGYSPGARPAEVAAYAYDQLTGDVFGLADALGWRDFHLVTHDWGALVGWMAMKRDASRIRSFTALSIPHIRAFAEATWADEDAEPYRKVLALILAPDGAAERVFGRDEMAGFRGTWVGDEALIAEYLRVLQDPGALTAALNWYRASNGHRLAVADAASRADQVATPTLLIWGENDAYVRRGSVDRAAPYMVGPYRVLALEAGHWLVQEQPQAVCRAVLEHLAEFG